VVAHVEPHNETHDELHDEPHDALVDAMTSEQDEIRFSGQAQGRQDHVEDGNLQTIHEEDNHSALQPEFAKLALALQNIGHDAVQDMVCTHAGCTRYPYT
jgi:hypothetical protein